MIDALQVNRVRLAAILNHPPYKESTKPETFPAGYPRAQNVHDRIKKPIGQHYKIMIKTKRLLAAKLGISRSTLDKFLHMPQAPVPTSTGFDELAVAKFISTHADGERLGARFNPEIARLKARELKLRCDRLAFKLETERGQWIPANVICSAIRNAYMHQKILLQQILETELPTQLVALNPIEIRQRMVEAVNRILAVQRNELKNWMASPPPATGSAPLIPENP